MRVTPFNGNPCKIAIVLYRKFGNIAFILHDDYHGHTAGIACGSLWFLQSGARLDAREISKCDPVTGGRLVSHLQGGSHSAQQGDHAGHPKSRRLSQATSRIWEVERMERPASGPDLRTLVGWGQLGRAGRSLPLMVCFNG